jgi:hypothetical protein
MHAVALRNRGQSFAGSAALERFSALIIAPLDVSASVFLLLFDSFGDGMEVHLTE